MFVWKTTEGMVWSFPIKMNKNCRQNTIYQITITFIQYLTYIMVISINNWFIYTTAQAFPRKYICPLTQRFFAWRKFERFVNNEVLTSSMCLSSEWTWLSTNQRARIYSSVVKNLISYFLHVRTGGGIVRIRVLFNIGFELEFELNFELYLKYLKKNQKNQQIQIFQWKQNQT